MVALDLDMDVRRLGSDLEELKKHLGFLGSSEQVEACNGIVMNMKSTQDEIEKKAAVADEAVRFIHEMDFDDAVIRKCFENAINRVADKARSMTALGNNSKCMEIILDSFRDENINQTKEFLLGKLDVQYYDLFIDLDDLGAEIEVIEEGAEQDIRSILVEKAELEMDDAMQGFIQADKKSGH